MRHRFSPYSRARRQFGDLVVVGRHSGDATFAEAITVAQSAVTAAPVMHMGGAFMPTLTHAVVAQETKHGATLWAEPDATLNSHKTVEGSLTRFPGQWLCGTDCVVATGGIASRSVDVVSDL